MKQSDKIIIGLTIICCIIMLICVFISDENEKYPKCATPEVVNENVDLKDYYYEFTEKDTYKKLNKVISQYNEKTNIENYVSIKKYEQIEFLNEDNVEKEEIYVFGLYKDSKDGIRKKAKVLIGKYNEKGITIYCNELLEAISIIRNSELVHSLHTLLKILQDSNINYDKVEKIIGELSNKNSAVGSILLPLLFDDVTVGLYDYCKDKILMTVIFIFVVIIIIIITSLLLKLVRKRRKTKD